MFVEHFYLSDLYPAPQFVSGATMTLTASQSFYLSVSIVANPLPNITWYKGSTILTSGASFSPVGDTGVASLYFPSLATSDAGSYSVNIINLVQMYRYTVTLNISGMLWYVALCMHIGIWCNPSQPHPPTSTQLFYMPSRQLFFTFSLVQSRLITN